MEKSFKVSPGEFSYILKRQSFLSLQEVLSTCVFAIVQETFPESSPIDEIFVHLDLRLQDSVLRRCDRALSVSCALHVLSKVLPSTISSLPRHSVNSQRLSLFRKLQSQLEDGFHGMTSFASVMLVNDSSLFHQSREDILFLRAVLGTLLLLQPSFSASIQAAIDDLDSCFHMTEAPFDLRSAAVPSLSCVVLIRAMVSICETAERHRISIELRKSPSRSVLWALTEVAKKGGMVVSPSQLKFLNDAVVELGCCYEQHVSARMLDAAGIVALLLKELKMSDMATASNETRSSFLNCLAAFADKCDGQESLPSVVLQATKSAISSCP
jgi:hypothetical protein